MEYKLLGVKFNVINVILCIALGFLICAMLGYNNKKIIEGARYRRKSKIGKTPKGYAVKDLRQRDLRQRPKTKTGIASTP